MCILKSKESEKKVPILGDSDWDAESENIDAAPYLQPFDDFDWLPELEDKIWKKHNLRPEDVEECFLEPDPRGRVRGTEESKYILYCHAQSGMYLFIVFAYKIIRNWRFVRVISARPMDKDERSFYKRKRK